MYVNLVFDEVCEEMLAETDLQAARQHAYALQTMLANDLPYVTLYGSPMFEAFRSDRVSLPFTQTLDGLQHWSGLPAMVRFVPIQGVIPSTGGTLEGLGSSLAFPPGAFTSTVNITYTVMPPTGTLPAAGIYFDINAAYSSTGQLAHLAPGMVYTLTVGYEEDALALGVSEASLKLYYWDDGMQDWVEEPTSWVDVLANTITATPDHFSVWAVFGGYSIYLPFISK